jgi:hypothetical protein
MSIFGQYKGGAEAIASTIATEALDDQSLDTNATQDGAVDPLQIIDDAFAAERQQIELNGEGDNTQLEEQQIDQGEDTGGKLPDGDFGDDADVTGTTDVKVDADDTDATFKNEIGDDEDESDYDDADSVDREIDNDSNDIEMLSMEIEQLSQTSIAIESYGMGPSTAAVMQITGLLNGTALESVGLESFSAPVPGDAESMMALEALGEKIKEKAASFAAKIVNVVKAGGQKILAIITSVWNKVQSLVTTLASKTWDAAKSVGQTIKAHPYKTIAGVVAAIAAVAAIVVYCGGAPAMSANINVVKAFMTKLASDISTKVKWAGGSVKATLNEAGTKIMLAVGDAKVAVKGAASTASSTVSNAASSAAKGAKDLARTAYQAGDKAVDAAKAGASTAASAVKGAAATAGKTVSDAASKVASAVKPAAAVKSGYQPMAGNYAMGSAKELGWTANAVKAIQGQLTRAWQTLKGGWTAFGTRSMSAANSVKSGAGAAVGAVKSAASVVTAGGAAAQSGAAKAAGTAAVKAGLSAGKGRAVAGLAGWAASSGYYSFLIGLVGTLVKLVKTVVVGGMTMIASTFRALLPISGGSAQAA